MKPCILGGWASNLCALAGFVHAKAHAVAFDADRFALVKGALLIAVLLALTSPLRAQLVVDGTTNILSNVTNSFPGDVTVGASGSFSLLVISNNALLADALNGLIGLNATAKSNQVQ